MPSCRLLPIPALLGCLLLGACAARPPTAAPQAAATPSAPALIAQVPESGPIILPAEPPATVALVAEGRKYLRGDGVATDESRAFALFQQAADLGSPTGRYRLGLVHLTSRDGRADPQKAAQLILPLAQQGYPDAAFLLGLVASGFTPAPSLLPASGESSLRQAPYWFNIARRAGQANARRAYEQQLLAMREDGVIPAGSGTGDDFANAIRFKGKFASSKEGVPLEYRTIGPLFPGWKRESQALIEQEGKHYDVLTLVNEHQQKVLVYFDISDWVGLGGGH
ncbi:hypothetical protein GE253_10940 [Niveispirillum sp. SYP-B3756]|uniref:tetratricopeptide repeat protein n=1 Tax=Niveispirillum sp. SYP-B3756 TaxID=2662178 RepID=UPI0012911C4B|nr:SEL1-like repeat protein [Niveispirillum sp. SYP-B3756]MQP65856.1 hypothetical protein [Niveispirillum sp. SYP-B3756]